MGSQVTKAVHLKDDAPDSGSVGYANVARTILASGGNAIDFVDALIPIVRYSAPNSARLGETGARALLAVMGEYFAVVPVRDQLALCVATQQILLHYWGFDSEDVMGLTGDETAMDTLLEHESVILGENAYFDDEDGEFKIPKHISDAERAFAAWFKIWLKAVDLPTECLLASFGNASFVLALITLSLKHDDPGGCLAVRAIGKVLLAPHLPLWEDLRTAMPESGMETFTRLFVALAGIASDARTNENESANERLQDLNPVSIHKHCNRQSAHYLSTILNTLEMASHPGESDLSQQKRIAKLAVLPENVQDLMTLLFESRSRKQYRTAIIGLPGLAAAKDRMRRRLRFAEGLVDIEAREEVRRAIQYINNVEDDAFDLDESPDA